MKLLNARLKTLCVMKKTRRLVMIKIGIYLRPALISPFLITVTSIAENSEVTKRLTTVNIRKSRWLTPTLIEVSPLEATVEYPEASEMGYFGEVRIPFVVRPDARRPAPDARSPTPIEVRVSYQACTESECLAPAEHVFTAVLEPAP